MSDRIAIMERGRIAQLGPPREVYEKPDSRFVASFLGEANLIPARRDGAMARGPGGAVLAAAGGAPDAESVAFIRPEKVRIAAGGGAEGPNSLPGRVLRASFLGNILRYEVEAGEGVTLLCDATNAAGTEPHRPGEAVTLTWRPEDSRFLAA